MINGYCQIDLSSLYDNGALGFDDISSIEVDETFYDKNINLYSKLLECLKSGKPLLVTLAKNKDINNITSGYLFMSSDKTISLVIHTYNYIESILTAIITLNPDGSCKTYSFYTFDQSGV